MKDAFCDRRSKMANIKRPITQCLSRSLMLHNVTTNESPLQSRGDITIISSIMPPLNVD